MLSVKLQIYLQFYVLIKYILTVIIILTVSTHLQYTMVSMQTCCVLLHKQNTYTKVYFYKLESRRGVNCITSTYNVIIV